MTTWLYQVTTRHCLNLLRNRRRRQELWDMHGGEVLWSMPTAAPSQEEQVFRSELWLSVSEELAQIGMHYYADGMTHAEIARVMGCSSRTISNRLSQLRELLRATSAEHPA